MSEAGEEALGLGTGGNGGVVEYGVTELIAGWRISSVLFIMGKTMLLHCLALIFIFITG